MNREPVADQQVLLALYEQSSEWARQHEMLRAQVVGLMLAVVAAVAALISSEDGVRPGDWLFGLIMLLGGMIGWLMLRKYDAKIGYYGRLTRLVEAELDPDRALDGLYDQARASHELAPRDRRLETRSSARGGMAGRLLSLARLWDLVPALLCASGAYVLVRALWLGWVAGAAGPVPG